MSTTNSPLTHQQMTHHQDSFWKRMQTLLPQLSDGSSSFGETDDEVNSYPIKTSPNIIVLIHNYSKMY